jgi:hypothetical protein
VTVNNNVRFTPKRCRFFASEGPVSAMRLRIFFQFSADTIQAAATHTAESLAKWA